MLSAVAGTIVVIGLFVLFIGIPIYFICGTRTRTQQVTQLRSAQPNSDYSRF
jgi:hypothetical protein